jgi:hypothetical protein
VNVAAPQPRITWIERRQAWASAAMQPIWGTVRQPRFATRCHTAHVLQHASPRSPVLRKYPVRV